MFVNKRNSLILFNENDKIGKITTMYTKENKRNNNIVSIFSSAQLAIILLALIIIASAAGTLIPAGDIYRSRWFILLLSLFWLNLFLCTFKRLKLWRAKFPSCITHIGLLVILAGALITCVFGERGFLIVYEGHSQDTFVRADRRLKELGFKIYLDDFLIEWYDSHNKDAAARRVKNFKSKITILEKGQIAAARTIEVNRPLKYKGYAFYQASYDQDELRWSGLEVAKDPGAPFVFGGFILLNIGITLAFYFRRHNH